MIEQLVQQLIKIEDNTVWALYKRESNKGNISLRSIETKDKEIIHNITYRPGKRTASKSIKEKEANEKILELIKEKKHEGFQEKINTLSKSYIIKYVENNKENIDAILLRFVNTYAIYMIEPNINGKTYKIAIYSLIKELKSLKTSTKLSDIPIHKIIVNNALLN